MNVIVGVAYALLAGLMWGVVFVVPLWLSEYPAALLAFGRFVALGMLSLPLAWLDRMRLSQLTRADWREAFKLSAVGNLCYYFFLVSAIQYSGAPLPTLIIGTLPIVISVAANWQSGAADKIRWSQLLPGLLIVGAGISLVNIDEMNHLRAQGETSLRNYVLGAAMAFVAMACWTWYPLRNAAWLRADRKRKPRVWSTAQGLTSLPLALLAYGVYWLWHQHMSSSAQVGFAMPFGPEPARFLGLMFAIALSASWLGVLAWNEASQRVPAGIAGQLIVFETLAALTYAFLWRGELPDWTTALGVALLVLGVFVSVARLLAASTSVASHRLNRARTKPET